MGKTNATRKFRREVLKVGGACVITATANPLWAALTRSLSAPLPPEGITRIAYGACLRQPASAEATAILEAIVAKKPEAMVWLGDNVYVDSISDDRVFAERYGALGRSRAFKELAAQCIQLATWDDHDYGADDADHSYPLKNASRRFFCDFWGVGPNSPRRLRPDGIYESFELHTHGRTVRIILLDDRWNKGLPGAKSKSTLLGETQWAWLSAELRQPAELRLVCSGIQVLNTDDRWEHWSDHPGERERLFSLVKEHKVAGVVLLSGDVHYAEASREPGAFGYDAWDFTGAALDQREDRVYRNRRRVGSVANRRQFGMIDVHWTSARPALVWSAVSAEGVTLLSQRVPLASLGLT